MNLPDSEALGEVRWAFLSSSSFSCRAACFASVRGACHAESAARSTPPRLLTSGAHRQPCSVTPPYSRDRAGRSQEQLVRRLWRPARASRLSRRLQRYQGGPDRANPDASMMVPPKTSISSRPAEVSPSKPAARLAMSQALPHHLWSDHSRLVDVTPRRKPLGRSSEHWTSA